ncbi:MAG: HsdR family type I site-specific deoxyribonuclease, partial [Methanosarcina sp.]|nr:HsdR family type I site-specific deoxyribonuclease [Methanosarcina sp.]
MFVRKDGELNKSVLRPHQIRASERALLRAGDAKKHRGLIWHTQGSGKTYTMITIAKKLLTDPAYQNPTVLMIVDRNELQQQLFQNLEAVNFERAIIATSKRELRDLLKRDTRGLIVSMIHKFDDMPPNICTRKNVYVLIDEAHRSTGADLGNYLMGALPNATFIGFTGTPIDKTAYGKGTFKTFGLEDDTGYLDKYSIKESIEDGTTVPLHYQMAPTDLIVDKQTMEEEFWKAAELEGVSDVEELDRVLDRAVTLKNMLKNPERVRKIAQFLADHYKEYVEPMGYKAFLVAVDREACCLYKEELDKHMKTEETAVIISPFYNDPPHIKKYHLSEDREKFIRKEFKKSGTDPKILIVTEKLLTGYDAPILYCMYLDKPMRDHVLLQAIARVNRPYETDEGQRKISGLIIDFVGIFDNLEKALSFDSKDVEGVIEDLDVLRERFKELMGQGQDTYLSIGKGLDGDKKVEAILEYFRKEDVRKEFYKFFRELEEVYEILSPDAFLRPFMKDYDQLVQMYRLVRSAYEPGVPVDKSFLRKTAEIVQRHTHTCLLYTS